ncbi:MAG: hypothetical protein HQL47_05505 [Gammaproteobacteria bacterium]|nr:hypothetical protein [Gammaproteobacteria bacterium]
MSAQAFADALTGQRETFNQRFLRAQQQNRRLDGERFAAVLRDQAAPVAEAVAKVAADRLDPVVSVLFDVCLHLTGLELMGPGSHLPQLDRAFRQLLPTQAALIAEDPERLIRSLSNAVYNLAMEPAADADRWIELMQALTPSIETPERWLEAGSVAAWRCGMAHYREGALTAAAQLPREILAPLFDLKPDDLPEDLLERLANPWYRPAAHPVEPSLHLVGRTGGFQGFGGPFVEPPEVARFGDQLYAFDRQQAWTLFADGFGLVMRRYGTELPPGEPVEWSQFGLDRKGNVSRGELRAHLPQLADWSSLAATEHTLAVTLPHSHHIFLVARL